DASFPRPPPLVTSTPTRCPPSIPVPELLPSAPRSASLSNSRHRRLLSDPVVFIQTYSKSTPQNIIHKSIRG
uniref:Uncharacterized protein n=1 Tax=Aegilops tauschii subsp. strangulata TaxID=200361 RepID=A0A453I954_AEGTS